MSRPGPEFLFLGPISEEYCITADGRALPPMPGGGALYAAVGARLWGAAVGVVARVGRDFSERSLARLQGNGWSVSLIRPTAEVSGPYCFYTLGADFIPRESPPAPAYLRINQPLPKPLLGYRSAMDGHAHRDRFAPLALRPGDLPPRLRGVRGAHLTPSHFLTHLSVPLRLRELGVTCITLSPSPRYMQPSFREALPQVVNGLEALIVPESAAHSLFQPETLQLHETASRLAAMGCATVVLQDGLSGWYVCDSKLGRRTYVPAYPARVVSAMGIADSFSGGFLVGLVRTRDPVEAALFGSASASVALEGHGALHPLDAMPGLVEARLESLRGAVRQE